MTILSLFASSRIGRTSWYSGESYHARAFSMLGNSSITILVGCQSPSRQSMLLVAAMAAAPGAADSGSRGSRCPSGQITSWGRRPRGVHPPPDDANVGDPLDRKSVV